MSNEHYDPHIGKGTKIEETSLVRGDVRIGKNSRVWNFCNIYGCRIGKNTQIGSYTEIKSDVVIGNNCRFQSYVFIPEGTKIGDYVFIGPRVTFLNDKFPTARKAIERTWNLEACLVEDDVTIGGGVILNPGVKLHKGSFVASGALVTKDVKKYSIVAGFPARVIGDVREGKYAKNIIGLRGLPIK